MSSRGGHAFTWDDNVRQYQNVHHNLTQKVSATRQLRDLLQERIRSLQKGMDATRQSLISLQTGAAKMDGPLGLCKWRLEQRAMRPQSELTRDSFE